MQTFKLQEQFRRGSADFPLEYYYVDAAHPRYHMPYHWHHEHEMLHVLSGSFELNLEGQDILLRTGDVAFVAPGRLHGGLPLNCVYECVVFDMGLLLKCDDAGRKLIWNVLNRRVSIDPIFLAGSDMAAQTLVPMFQALRTGSVGATLMTLGCLYMFLGKVYRAGAYRQDAGEEGDENKRTAVLAAVFEKIERDYARPLSLRDLAAAAHLSPKYFCRLFKEVTHSTPIGYLLSYRIETACAMLASTDKNVTQIALDIGFSDVNYFIRAFKKQKGVTPKKYMQLMSMDAPFNEPIRLAGQEKTAANAYRAV